MKKTLIFFILCIVLLVVSGCAKYSKSDMPVPPSYCKPSQSNMPIREAGALAKFYECGAGDNNAMLMVIVHKNKEQALSTYDFAVPELSLEGEKINDTYYVADAGDMEILSQIDKNCSENSKLFLWSTKSNYKKEVALQIVNDVVTKKAMPGDKSWNSLLAFQDENLVITIISFANNEKDAKKYDAENILREMGFSC